MTRSSLDRIVILGAGFGGAYCAQALERERPEVETVLIDRHNYFAFYPLLVEAGTGSLEPRHAVVSVRAFIKNTRFLMGEVVDVDLENRSIHVCPAGRAETRSISYTHLVLALGSVSRVPAIPGLNRYGFEMKSLRDAVRLRDHAIRLLEMADASEDERERRALLHLVVVGGNFTGVEVAGEYQNFLQEASRFYKRVRARDCHLTLVELGDRILGALGPGLSDYALRHMQRRGIHIRLNNTVSQIGADTVYLRSGEEIPSRTVIWCAGVAPPPLLRRLALPVDEKGYVLTDRQLRVRGKSDVWAIGDCAVNLDVRGNPYPPTAQHAVRQGRHLARNLSRVLQGQSAVSCDIRSRGSLVAIGCRTGVASLWGIRFSGFLAWFLYRTAYLLKMPGWARKLRIALDWTIGLFFSRDVVQLGVHRSGREGPRAQIPR